MGRNPRSIILMGCSRLTCMLHDLRRIRSCSSTPFSTVVMLPLSHKFGQLNLYGPLTVSDLLSVFFVEIFGVFLVKDRRAFFSAGT